MKPNLKPIPPDESSLFNVIYQENKKEFEYPWHYHPEVELTYVPKGHGLRYVGNNVENFFDDDLVLIGSNLPHCWINEPGSRRQSPRAIVVYLKQDFFEKAWLQSCEFKNIRYLLELSERGIKFGHDSAQKLKDKFFDLLKLPPFQKFMQLMVLLQDLSESPDYRLLCEHDFSCELNPSNSERINVVYKYIDAHYQDKITLASISEQVFMSPEYFSRFFSKTMKKSFFEFLNEYRVNKSCRLLIETDMQITDICFESGFDSLPFFYRQFKKFKKYPPNQYRQKYQQALL